MTLPVKLICQIKHGPKPEEIPCYFQIDHILVFLLYLTLTDNIFYSFKPVLWMTGENLSMMD
ncbi:MAG: hypothetical protein JWQ30_95 [Sediminibacterium sp.]|nr:hypothetical protein [Sediminibacterium sp.]